MVTAHGLFGLFVPSAVKPVVGMVMERFPSREFAGRTLQRRVLTGKSDLYSIYDRHAVPTTWPVLDETAYMRVWLRAKKDVPHPLSRPDEEWIIKESGAVERIAWIDGESEPLKMGAGGFWLISNPT